MKIAAITSGLNIPSARFRIRQHLSLLQDKGIEINEYRPYIEKISTPAILNKMRRRYLLPIAGAELLLSCCMRIPGIVGSRKADLTWIERNFIPGFETLIKTLKSPRVLDVDDSLWISYLNSGYWTKIAAKNVDLIIAGNDYLANFYSDYCKKIEIVPTAIDCKRFKPGIVNRSSFNIGWTGTSGNFKYLYMIENAISDFLKKTSRFKISYCF